MRKVVILVAGLCTTMIAGLLWAQGPGGPGGGGPGGPGGGFRVTPKQMFLRSFRGLGQLKRQPLKADQATKILALVNPWKTKTKMTDDDAKDLQKKLKPILTAPQLNELDTIQQSRPRFGGGGGGGGKAGGGGGGGGFGKGGFNMDAKAKAKMMSVFDKMRDANPLNVKAYEVMVKDMQKDMPDSPFAGRMGRSIQGTKDTFAALEKAAKSKK